VLGCRRGGGDVANVVAARWETFLHGEASVRGFAFASHVDALDAEEAADGAGCARFANRQIAMTVCRRSPDVFSPPASARIGGLGSRIS
jgi:hypothetical protein